MSLNRSGDGLIVSNVAAKSSLGQDVGIQCPSGKTNACQTQTADEEALSSAVAICPCEHEELAFLVVKANVTCIKAIRSIYLFSGESFQVK